MVKDIEQKVKNKLLTRGFSNDHILKNRRLIRATIDETNLENLEFLNVIIQENERQICLDLVSWLYEKHDKGVEKMIVDEYLNDK